MYLWAGIDEAGYGPLLGPLVVAGTCFMSPVRPREGFLWEQLQDAVSSARKGLDGRVMVADSKQVYSRARGLGDLEDAVLSFMACLGRRPATGGALLSGLGCRRPEHVAPWFESADGWPLPVSTLRAAVESKAGVLQTALGASGVAFDDARAVPVLPGCYNRFLARTGNKSLLLWQKCGGILQGLWHRCDGTEGFVLVDRHGGRMRYRTLLREAFPQCRCDVVGEDAEGSVYRLAEGRRTMWVAFKQEADRLALPVSLASMLAKYVRELYMIAFNAYWCARVPGLKPTAGYAQDGVRFLDDIRHDLLETPRDMDELVRRK